MNQSPHRAVDTCFRIFSVDCPSYIERSLRQHHKATSPIQRSRQVIPRPQRQNRDRRHSLPLVLLDHVQHPAHRPLPLRIPRELRRICPLHTPKSGGSPVPRSSAAPRAGFSPADRRLGSDAARVGTAGADGCRTGRPIAN